MPDRPPVLAIATMVALGLLATTAFAQRGALERLTLDQAVARALARSPDVLIAAAEVRRAEALVIEARSRAMPTLVPTASYTRIDEARRFMGMTALAADQYGAAAPLAVPLVAPRAWAEWAHATDDRRVSELDAGQVRRQVAIAVANAYLTVIAQRRTLELTVVSRDSAASLAEYTRLQAAAGAVSDLDAVRAQQQLHTTQAQVEFATLSLARAQEALGVLVAGDQPVDAAENPTFVLPGAAVPSPERADLRWLRMRQTAARNQLEDTYVDYLPSLSGVFQPTFTQPPTFIQPRWAWQLTLTVVIPIYDGGLRRSRRLQRSALLDEATDTLNARSREARSEVRLGRAAIALAEARAREATAAAGLARRALQISTLRYRQGATSNLEVIDAEREARQAALGEALAEDNAQQVRLDLLAAIGAFP